MQLQTVMLYLRHDFYNIIFKIKHKLYIALGSDPSPKEKFWVCTCFKDQWSCHVIPALNVGHPLWPTQCVCALLKFLEVNSHRDLLLLGYYAALSGRFVQTFRDNLSVPTSKVKKSKKTGINSHHCSHNSLQRTAVFWMWHCVAA